MSGPMSDKSILLEVADLRVHFDIRDNKAWFWQPPKRLKAVDGVTLRLYQGRRWALSASQAAASRPLPAR